MNEAVQLKRNGKFDEASDIYAELNIRFPDHPGILKSWAKISVCQFKYNQAIEKFETAIRLYEKFNNQQEIFQCSVSYKIFLWQTTVFNCKLIGH